MYYLKSRYYDPITCRFVSSDETAVLEFSNGLKGKNLFAYCENNPQNAFDYQGFWTVTFSQGVDLTFFAGISVSWGYSFDDKGNFEPQLTYAIPGVKDTMHMGLCDLSKSSSLIITDASSVNKLKGKGTYVGASVGSLPSVGLGIVSFDPNLNSTSSKINGVQASFGASAGVDFGHIGRSKTVPISFWRNEPYNFSKIAEKVGTQVGGFFNSAWSNVCGAFDQVKNFFRW